MQIDPLWGYDERRDFDTQHNTIEYEMMERWLLVIWKCYKGHLNEMK